MNVAALSKRQARVAHVITMQNIFTDPLIAVEGFVSGMQRTTHVTSNGDSSSTTHITFFNLEDHRVELRLPGPPPIANGDRVRVVGQADNGAFIALACRDFDTGWVSDTPNGCRALLMIFGVLLTSTILSLLAFVGGAFLSPFVGRKGFYILLPLAAVIPCIIIWLLLRAIAQIRRVNLARRMAMA